MLKVTFPLLTLLLIEVNKTETQRGVSINSVKILHDPNDQRNIKEGSKITLTCSGNIVTLPGQTSQVLYLFYKGQNKDILLQNGTSDRKDSQYTIQSARASHSGYYCCVMEAGSERRESEPTFLTVQGNLQAPVLTIHPINVTVGDSTELRCTSEEIPPLTFIFYKYKDGQKSYRFHDIKSNNDFSMYQLKVTAATEKTYSCAVQGNGPLIESKHSEIVQIIVQDPFSDPVFEIEPSDTIFEGDILTIKCKVNFLPLFHGIQPKLTIVKDTTAIHIKDNATTVFSKRATANDAGEYKCMAEWKDVLKITMRQVNVTVPVSTPTLIPTPTGDNVVEGGILNLSCAVLKGSYPITYKFYKATSETPLHQITLNATTAVHRIISVNNENNGKYSCEASNTANQKPRTKKSQYIIITVKGAQWWIYALALVSVVSIAIVITVLCIRYHKQRSKNNKDKNQVDESYETCQIGSLQHNQEADSDRDHEVDYTNIRALKRNGDTLTRTDSESDCEGDYTNVTTKRKAANTHSDSSSDENNEVSYTQLDLAQPQNSNMPQKPGPTIYASILFNSYGAGVLEKSES
ncbi:Fc receptor-like protein 5 isoform X6 [Carcharodon carcharias]|uniref:Fc receptor-like protein 5 isoform X6 n=1 Tax=Carcharodon carcharias TaxID=13397 RepID=UPI001B7DE178|nr:Fc receptor-like protein 5 isoform X6 [Carcharodon carcharias]